MRPRGRVIAIDMRKPEPDNWKEIIPQATENLHGVDLVGNCSCAHYLKDARTQVKMYTLDGTFVREVEFPGIGTRQRLRRQAQRDRDVLHLLQLRHAAEHLPLRPDHRQKQAVPPGRRCKFDPDDYEVKQVFYASKDGTKVPMFITLQEGHRARRRQPDAAVRLRRLQHSADAAVFRSAKLPGWRWAASTPRPTCAAAANTARNGTRPADEAQTQNAYDDFIAAAEWLIDKQVHAAEASWPSRAAATAACWSGPCMTQRPDLFGACLPAVGVMDMLRFHKFTAGRYWVDDYGSPDDPEEFKVLLRLFAVSQPEEGNQVPGHAGDDGRHRRPRGAGAQLQVHRPVAVLPGRAGAGAGPHRDPRGPRRGQADEQDRSRRSPISGRFW